MPPTTNSDPIPVWIPDNSSEYVIGVLAGHINTMFGRLNKRIDQLSLENKELAAQNRELREAVESLRSERSEAPHPPATPPPPPPPPPPGGKRKRTAESGTTPHQLPKAARETSPEPGLMHSMHAGPANDSASPEEGPASPPATTTAEEGDGGWKLVKVRRRKGKDKDAGEQKKGEKETGRRGQRKERVPTWAQIARGGGVSINVFVGGYTDTKPTKAHGPRRKRPQKKSTEQRPSGENPQGQNTQNPAAGAKGDHGMPSG